MPPPPSPTSEKVQDTARPFLSICGRRMTSVPPWNRMRVGSCLVRGEVLTLYLQEDGEGRTGISVRPGGLPGATRAWGSHPRPCRPGADVRVAAHVDLPEVQPRAVVPAGTENDPQSRDPAPHGSPSIQHSLEREVGEDGGEGLALAGPVGEELDDPGHPLVPLQLLLPQGHGARRGPAGTAPRPPVPAWRGEEILTSMVLSLKYLMYSGPM